MVAVSESFAVPLVPAAACTTTSTPLTAAAIDDSSPKSPKCDLHPQLLQGTHVGLLACQGPYRIPLVDQAFRKPASEEARCAGYKYFGLLRYHVWILFSKHRGEIEKRRLLMQT